MFPSSKVIYLQYPYILGLCTKPGNAKDPLKVPKRENFSLAFFTLSEPIWVCDLGTGTKIDFFIN